MPADFKCESEEFNGPKCKVQCASCKPMPVRHRTESPVQYFKRTKCVDDRYFHVHKGRYYCNPAHCSHSWKSKAKRDEHLESAYAILD